MPDLFLFGGPKGAGKTTTALARHFIPDDIVRRRYERGLVNFVTLYQPLADYWIALDNSAEQPNSGARPVAKGSRHVVEKVYEPEIWELINVSGMK